MMPRGEHPGAQLLAIGANQRSAPLAVRERLAISPRELSDALTTLHQDPDVAEIAILSTCNRFELYVAAPHPARTLQTLMAFLGRHSGLPSRALREHLYVKTGEEVARHLFHVTAGLDSMVLGESEITAQVKQAYDAAFSAAATGPQLNPLFQKALHSTKIVRSRTRIAEGRASIGSVVVTLAEQLFPSRVQDCEVLLWGAGKAAEATAKHLMAQGMKRLWIVSRTAVNAQHLAGLCQAGWLSWEQAKPHLRHVDIAIVCTQAPHYVIDGSDIDSALTPRAGRPLCLIDLSVPRNIDPALSAVPGISLYDIDGLQAIARKALSRRRRERALCAKLIEQQVRHFAARVPSTSNILRKEEPRCRPIEACVAV